MDQTQNTIRILPLLISLGVTQVLGTSCALYNPSSDAPPVVTKCSIPADQSATTSGHWTTLAVPVAFHQSDFSPEETTSMTNAADSWNTFFTKSKNKKVIDYGTAGSARVSTTADPVSTGALCSQGILQGTTFNGNVVIYKLARWPASYPASAIALTSFCTFPASPFPRMYMAVMEVNFQNFFVTAKIPDLQSIILHEMGHLMGLNHSCEFNPKAGTPNCSTPNLNPDYISASMFPQFNFDQNGAGQQKRSLGANDQGRVNCLY